MWWSVKQRVWRERDPWLPVCCPIRLDETGWQTSASPQACPFRALIVCMLGTCDRSTLRHHRGAAGRKARAQALEEVVAQLAVGIETNLAVAFHEGRIVDRPELDLTGAGSG